MKLNLGSGEQLLEGYVNFDCVKVEKHGKRTDVIGKIQELKLIWKDACFDSIIAFHSLEHLTRPEVVQAIKDCFHILKPGGTLVVEGPDVLGAYEYYVNQKKNVAGYIYCIFGEDFSSRNKYGDSWSHKSGWTGDLMSQAMKQCGFSIKAIGPGLSHGMGTRDFRVEGLKPAHNA